ncbi:MAG: hypothetical protein RLZZ387_3146 [Chloroflexota bacterium]|jgi:site-specific recombinase XerD
MGDSITPRATAPEALTRAALEAVRRFAEQSRSAATRRAYQADWRDFSRWCEARALPHLPAAPVTVAAYLAESAARLKPSTLQRRLASISQAHQLAGHPSPTRDEQVRTVLKGIRRVRGTAPAQKAAAGTEVVRALVAALGDDLAGLRDRALLLVGFAGAFRRSELVALDAADVTFAPEGMLLRLRRSKTDQEGRGETKGIPLGKNAGTCPVRALQAWVRAAAITEGPLFRRVDRWGRVGAARLSDRSVARVVQRAAAAAGFDPADYAGHSLRAGFATSAAAAGVSDRAIMRQTGHRSRQMLDRYVRAGGVFRENAAAEVGL